MFFCLAYGAGYIAIEKRNANTDKQQAGHRPACFLEKLRQAKPLFAIRSALLLAQAQQGAKLLPIFKKCRAADKLIKKNRKSRKSRKI